MRRPCLFHLIACFLLTASGPALAAETPAGMRLDAYLDGLNATGVRVIYSSDLVRPDMLLESVPEDASRASLAATLRPFGLSLADGPSGSLLVVPSATAAPTATIREDADLPIPEIVVTSSLHRVVYSSPENHTYLDRELATRMPVTGDEAVRLTHRLPGVASGGISSRAHIRGGEVNEVLFLLDGLRLYEPFHLKDFQSVATIVNSNAIGGIDFYSGAYPARYGDRMSAVMSLDLREPEKRRETELALSFFNASLLSAGTFGDDEGGEWLLAARRGNLDLIADVVNPEFGNPTYQDYLAHVGRDFGSRLRLSANVLVSDDKLGLTDAARGEAAGAEYANRVAWIKWSADWSERLSSETIVSLSDIGDRRAGTVDLPGIVAGSLEDRRDFRALEVRQDWQWNAAESWMLRFGLNLKNLDGDYRVELTKQVLAPFDAIFGNEPAVEQSLATTPAGAQYGLYSEFRWQPERAWTIDLGLRWDQQNYTTARDDRQYSPRVGILYRPGNDTELRVGWGTYFQAQEINELQISDGITDFFPAQRAEHTVVNLRQRIRGNYQVAVSLYRKRFSTLRPRFENVLNPLTLLPELQFDRVRIDAASGEARGAEILLLRESSRDSLSWWIGYAWSLAEDKTPEGRVRRSWDQTHAGRAGLSFGRGDWRFSFAAESRTGWPRTLLAGNLVDDGGLPELQLTASARNAFRYSVFHSLDARVSRDFDLRRGDLTAYLEVTNLIDRANPCCSEFTLADDGTLVSRETHWLPIVPSLGVVWRF